MGALFFWQAIRNGFPGAQKDPWIPQHLQSTDISVILWRWSQFHGGRKNSSVHQLFRRKETLTASGAPMSGPHAVWNGSTLRRRTCNVHPQAYLLHYPTDSRAPQGLSTSLSNKFEDPLKLCSKLHHECCKPATKENKMVWIGGISLQPHSKSHLNRMCILIQN